MEKLLISVIGKRNSGKSSTWNSLFGRTVKTGTKLKKLYLNETEYVNVFLVSGSPEERETYVGQLITVNNPTIVLCSMQYRKDVCQTIDYFIDKNYHIYTHWLNPGSKDQNEKPELDTLGIFNYLIGLELTVGIRNGKVDLNNRVQEIREYIYGWSKYRNLILRD
ncbi:hypothetical protein [Mesonia maritima]|uniref:G domain-containing protein n=1 Tax=Mesonia maritima TaxID=1793873 RepID=A0ABU1K800_9FLAO|nr:hypothetical protein [Mesonia maritima]MDR6300673.1 hypothetical protein [Mesonia maritima]